MQIEFPISFPVFGTPVSYNSKTTLSKERWKETVREAAGRVVDAGTWLTAENLALTIYDFPSEGPLGDVDNIIKLIQDALTKKIYIDDKQISRVVAQRFLVEDTEDWPNMPDLVAAALVNDRPFVYISITNTPVEDAE